MKKKTIGELLPKLKKSGTDIQMRANAFWTVARDEHGTHANICVRVLLLQDNLLLVAQAPYTVAARTADYPADEQWASDSEAAREANALVSREETKDYSTLPCGRFWGVNRAMPWEVVPPPRIPWYKRLWHLIAG
jgi:hypothetical protein